MNADFLDVDDVLAIHEIQIADHGGSIEIRDMGLLKSAVAQPSMTFGGDSCTTACSRWRRPTCSTSRLNTHL